jgi:acetyl-CoA C-acetyltransferase
MNTVIVSGARTPVGKILGSLSPLRADALAGHAIAAAIERAQVLPTDIDVVQFGNVVQAGVGPNTARLAAVAAGIPLRAPATTVNKLCLSGLTSIAYADLLISSGHARVAVAGGVESMTNAPHLTALRRGRKFGSSELADALERDALICGIDNESMGRATDRYQRKLQMSRADQDEFALRSHHLAAAAMRDGKFAEEIVPIAVSTGSGNRMIGEDEGVRPESTLDSLTSLRPAFDLDGSITAGSSSPLSDGAAAVIAMEPSEARRRGIAPLAEILAYGTAAGPDPSLLLQPAAAIRDALARASLTLADVHLFEINEAFASVVLASSRELDIDVGRVNVNGGAIALGHPVGMSGARLVLSLAYELRRRGGGIGVAALCGGGGQGDALVLRV